MNLGNNGPFISAAIDEYRYTLEPSTALVIEGGEAATEKRPLGERNPRGLQDDYVKFVRFAQLKMDEADEGVVGVITNHAWLDNATFRGMRQSLRRSFEQIYVLDLHGNAKKKERAPDGSKDENVFDIEQGVAVALFVKRPGLERGVWRGELWGKRLSKYKVLADSNLPDLSPTPIQAGGPDYTFVVQDYAVKGIYNLGWSIAHIFALNNVGIVTARDDFTLAYTRDEIWKRVQSVVGSDAEAVRGKYDLGRDTRDWTVHGASEDLKSEALDRVRLKPLLYRPLDTRFTYVTGR